MAIQISGTTVVNNSRELQNIASLDATTAATIGAAAGGGVTLLGTLTPTVGATSLTLSSVDLSGYTFLEVHVNHVRLTNNNAWIALNNNSEADALGKQATGAGVADYGMFVQATVNLSTSVMYSGTTGVLRDSGTDFLWAATNDQYAGGRGGMNVTTSTTSLTINVRSGYSFQAAQGNIKFYGVA